MGKLVAAVVVTMGLTLGMVSAQAPSDTFPLHDFGIVPRAASKTELLRLEPIQDELRLTDEQKRATARILDRFQAKFRGARDIKEDAKRFAALQTLQREREAAMIEGLSKAQRKRLEQIQLQCQGPIAFRLPEFQHRLGLSDEQVENILPIVNQGMAEIEKAATVPLPAPPEMEETAGSLVAIREQFESRVFQETLSTARHEARSAWDETVRRIEDEMTGPQRREYRMRLGPRFDMAKPRSNANQGAVKSVTVRTVTRLQHADPDFKPEVDRPAYRKTHPQVVIDEAHHNFHTAGGRYKPFADLLTSDGYRVIPGKDPFTRATLNKANVLVIANALGAEGMGSPGANRPAFTESECEAVQRWVNDGGSLLLISDIPPTGSAAAGLSRRFGVVMSQGLVIDLKNSANGPAQLVFSRENLRLGDHPITRGRKDSERIEQVMTFAGQSLTGSEGSVSFLMLGDTATDEGGSVAGQSQGLALRYGQGRVVVLGEAGQLSAQILEPLRTPMGMNVPGIDNQQLALNIMHWLSGRLKE